MSEEVHYKGTLTKVVKLEGEIIEDQCKRLLDNKELESYYDSYEEKLLDQGYYDYIVREDTLYSVEKQDINPYEDVFIANKNQDGTISFELKYYNGGCGFNEAIEYALENIEAEDK